MLRRESLHFGIDGGAEFAHGLLQRLLKNCLARLEPLAAIIALQVAEEGEAFRGKAGKCGWHKFSSLIIEAMPTTEETQLRLAEIPNLTVFAHTPLARFPRLGIGGPADLFAETRDERAFIAAVEAARGSGTPVMVTGGGTNLIISDAGFRGLVLRFVNDTLSAAGTRVTAGAGATLQDLVDFANEAGVAGVG